MEKKYTSANTVHSNTSRMQLTKMQEISTVTKKGETTQTTTTGRVQ